MQVGPDGAPRTTFSVTDGAGIAVSFNVQIAAGRMGMSTCMTTVPGATEIEQVGQVVVFDPAGQMLRRFEFGRADYATTRRSPSGRTARCTPSRAAARGACACFDTQGGLLREGIGAAVLLCRAGVIGGRAGWLDLRRRARDRRDLSFCARRRAVGALRPVAVRPVRAGSCRPVVIAIRAGRLLRDCRAGGAQRCGMSSPPTPTPALRSWCESASTERSSRPSIESRPRAARFVMTLAARARYNDTAVPVTGAGLAGICNP